MDSVSQKDYTEWLQKGRAMSQGLEVEALSLVERGRALRKMARRMRLTMDGQTKASSRRGVRNSAATKAPTVDV